jgi:hypothetical protein
VETRVFLVSILEYKTCHIPPEQRCLHKVRLVFDSGPQSLVSVTMSGAGLRGRVMNFGVDRRPERSRIGESSCGD